MSSVSRSCALVCFAMIIVAQPFPLEAQSVPPASCSFQYFPVPSSTFTIVSGINDFGSIVGQANLGNVPKGFIRWANGGLTFVKVPNSQGMGLNARNNKGVSVGGYTLKGDPGTPEDPGNPVNRAFLMKGSTFTTILPPKSKDGTFARGINKFGTVVGSYLDVRLQAHGFRLWSSGSYDELKFPGAVNTAPWAINDNGFIVGSYNATGQNVGFIFRNGSWASLAYPDPATHDTFLVGISNAGTIVGQFERNDLSVGYFLYRNGAFETVDGGVAGISPNGTIVGASSDSNGVGHIFTATCK